MQCEFNEKNAMCVIFIFDIMDVNRDEILTVILDIRIDWGYGSAKHRSHSTIPYFSAQWYLIC